jgi:hypothetical protein
LRIEPAGDVALRTSPVVAEPFTNPPGYNSLSANVAMLKAGGKRGGFVRDRHGNPVEQTTASIEQLIESGTCFAGTADGVYDQIKALSDSVGSFGNLLRRDRLTPSMRRSCAA